MQITLLLLSGFVFAVLFGVYSVPGWVGIPCTVFVVVYITNAINLIDGIGGLASGLCCISFSWEMPAASRWAT